MTIQEFVQDFNEKKIMNNKIAPDAINKYINEKLTIKTYIPFREKVSMVQKVVNQNIKWINGIKKYDSINGYVDLVIASIVMHTDLSFSQDPVADYDLLAGNGLLPQIIATFQESYSECNTLLKMAVDTELEDNNVNVFISKFLNGILDRLDKVGEVLKDKFGDINIVDILDSNFKEEDLAKLSSFLDIYNK